LSGVSSNSCSPFADAARAVFLERHVAAVEFRDHVVARLRGDARVDDDLVAVVESSAAHGVAADDEAEGMPANLDLGFHFLDAAARRVGVEKLLGLPACTSVNTGTRCVLP
jgi:hypothetical protein